LRPNASRIFGIYTALFFLDVMGDDFDHHRGLGIKPFVVRLHRGESYKQHVHDVVFLIGLQHILHPGQQLRTCRYMPSFSM
jgi:hypothetical protein